jgi:hypothetical protein
MNSKVFRYFKILIVFIFVLLVAAQAGKSFVLDEIDFPIVAHATSLSGKPIYYRGETEPFHVGTYHPTLYINSLATFVKAFGYNETTVRFFGAGCTLAVAYLLVLILRQLTKKSELNETLLLALYLFNPYTLANTTLPDIDSTVLPVVLLLFIYFSLRYLLTNRDMSRRVVVILGGLFALTLWSKLTTPLIIPPFLACLALITTKDYKKSLLFSLRVAALGAATFVVTYFMYCKLLDLSASYTYHFLVDSFTKGTNSGGILTSVRRNLQYTGSFAYWPTLPVFALFLVSFIGMMLDRTKDEKTRIKQLLLVTGLAVSVFYLALISPFGGFFKYPFPVFGLLLLNIVFFYDRYFRTIKMSGWHLLTALFVGFLLEKIYWKDTMFVGGKPFTHLLVLFLLMIAVWYVLLKVSTRRIAPMLFVLSLLFAIGFQLSISRIQAIAPYPTKYHYGQVGLDQTTAYLRSNTTPTEAIWSMKDVGYYVNNRYYESYSYYFDKSLQSSLVDMMKAGQVRYYVASIGIGEDNLEADPEMKQILDTNGVQEKQFGNFIIYKAKE